MKRTLHIWLLYALCLVALGLGMAWLTHAALRAGRSEETTRRRAREEQVVGIALWRMDAILITLTAREAALPWYAYQAFYPAETAYTRLFAPLAGGEVLVPSPLLTRDTPRVRLHFQFGPDGALSSPEAPQSNMRDLAEMRYLPADAMEERAGLLGALAERFDFQSVVRELTLARRDPPPPPAPEPDLSQMAISNVLEFSKRQEQAIAPRIQPTLKVSKGAPPQPGPSDTGRVLPEALSAARSAGHSGEVTEEPFRPLWSGGELYLLRWVRGPDGDLLQGCWLDWPAIETELLGEVRDLLPEASLRPVTSSRDPQDPARMLAALPVMLNAGPVPMPGPSGQVPLVYALAAGWACVVLSAMAIGWVLWATLSLSERRATFVSAVTHELRTPLTTFRMYTDLLLEGRVPDPDRRRLYLETLQAESVRLAHLVENVLAFARLERGRAIRHPETVALGDCLDRMVERLGEHCRRAGMALEVSADPAARAVLLGTDTAAVEQILLNLVDNACKYARAGDAPRKRAPARGAPTCEYAPTTDASGSSSVSVRESPCYKCTPTTDAPRVGLNVSLRDRWIVFRVSDTGPGIPRDRLRRLFTPFHKSAGDAARSAPGVGLGLALSRRLARRLGGDLIHTPPSGGGAAFELRLPRHAA